MQTQSFSEFVDCPDMSDVTFEFPDGQTIRASKLLLSGRSNYFRNMFTSGMQESQAGSVVKISGCKFTVFRTLVEFIYSSEPFTMQPDTIVEVFELAEQYQIDALCGACLKHMIQNISSSNVLSLYALAHVHGSICDGLKTASVEYMSRDLKRICSSEEFKDFHRNVSSAVMGQLFIDAHAHTNPQPRPGNSSAVLFLGGRVAAKRRRVNININGGPGPDAGMLLHE